MNRITKTCAYAAGAMMLSTSAMAAQLVPVLTGGVGESSQEAITEAQQDYNLKVVFTGERGMYLSDVAVSLRNKDGLEVIRGVTQGPFLLAELEPGTYTLEAQIGQFNKQQTITVGKAMNVRQVSFPVKDNIEVSEALNQ